MTWLSALYSRWVRPPAVRYSLTALGVELAARATPLIDWLDQNETRIERARAKSHAETEARRATELRSEIAT